jgi:TRAP transporter TAXI family solute receptor
VAEDPARPQTLRRRLRNFLRRKEGSSRFSFKVDRHASKDGAFIILPVVLLIVAAFWFAARYVRPAPPDTFVLSTGAEGGAYHLFGQRYRDILARDDVHVELRASAGSVENLERLADPSAGVEAAFVQSGVATPEVAADLVSLGSVYYEPLWIFYRSPKEITLLNDMLGRRIAIGPEGSGTRALALQLLRAVGADSATAELEPLGGGAAADALMQGRIDAVFFVASPQAPVVQRLIKAEGVRLLSLANAEAFTRRFPFLSMLTLPRGVVDLAAQLPIRDVTLLAATANIVVREDFHPALISLLLHAADEIHSASGVLQRHREFPAGRETEFALSDEARRYFKTGPPFLRRYLPFWLANPVERMLVMLVPLFVVLLPAIKILPALIQWRARSRVFRWYGEIKFLEEELLHHPDSARASKMLARLDEIERGVDRTSVPRAYADYSYNLRMHIDMVRNRITRLSHGGAQAGEDIPHGQSGSEQHRSA